MEIKSTPSPHPPPSSPPQFSDVNSHVRVWRKVPKSDAESVALAAAAVRLKMFLRRAFELVSKQIASPCRLLRCNHFGRILRKVPESDAQSVVLAATAVMLKIFLRRVLELVSKQIASPCRLQRAMEDVALLRPQVLQPRPRLPIPRRQLPQRLCRH